MTTVIRGGTVVDGTGAPAYRADVAIDGGRVTEIGANLKGDTEIDASGHVVAPGFIDIHTHYDAQVFWDPALTPSSYHGITTVVAGNCGFSLAPTRPEDRELLAQTLEKVEDMDPAALNAGIPWDFETFPEYLASVERHGVVLNYAAYVGHTPLRRYVMGDDSVGREATDDEVAKMSALIAEAMKAGAAGFATSLAVTHMGADGRPIPSRWASAGELEALSRAVGDAGRGVVGVNGGAQLNFSDVYEMAPRIGAPITYTALLTIANGMHNQMVEVHREGRARGVDVWPQVSCRPLSFSMTMVEPFTLNTNPVFAAIMALGPDGRRKSYADPAWRHQVRQAWIDKKGLQPRWDTYEIMESTAHPELVGRKLTDLVAADGDPLDRLLELALDEPDTMLRVRATLANDDMDGVTMLLGEDQCTLGLSDAGAHVGQLCDAVMSTDLLGTWVRDRQVLTIEQAVHKLTQVQADLFGFEDRGVLRRGAWADVVVFDPATVAPGPTRRVRDFPANAERLTADQPVGMRHLFVNGAAVQIDGQMLASALVDRPGQIVRPGIHRR